ncbi:MAG: efflux RND transporter periplasmic adaptor subunit [Thermodesulfobacteriota bacterium]|nr:efflux RND transporter periplasmic adaptor subunit [Thermodesulfobacteriota bacterium]
MKRKKINILLSALLLLTFSACSEEKATTPPPEPPPLNVEAIIVKNEPIPIWLEYTGKTEASKRIAVRARVAGILENVLFTEGNLVEKGQKLFEIEKDSFREALQQVRSKRDRDLATLGLAIADVKRYKPLVAEGLAPRATLEQYQARRNEYIAVVEGDKAAIRNAELDLSYTDVVAPISGRISRLQVDVGNIVGFSEKTLLTTIVSDDPMYVYFSPTEQDFQIMRKYGSGAALQARVRIPETHAYLKRDLLKGHISFSDNRVDSMTGTITMRATVDNPDHDLLEGMFVYVEAFVSDQYPFMVVPPQVVLEDQRGSFLYIVDENSTAKRVDVERGYEGRHYLQIENGLNDGDKVIISAIPKLRPDMKVAATDVTADKGVQAVMRKQQMAKEQE